MNYNNYLSKGWSLIPIADNKIPAIPWKKYQTVRAISDEVESWLEKGWTLGLVTGAISGVTVVDDDRFKHGLNEWGVQSNVIVKTRSGGKHYYFKHNGERNTVNPTLHLDIRGEGGYVKLPPYSGYEWIKPPTNGAFAPMNTDLLNTINPPHKIGERVNLSDVMGTGEGSRDDSLLRAANSICNKYSGDEAYMLLVGVNNSFNPPLPEQDLLRIFNQASNFVASHPKVSVNTPNSMQMHQSIAPQSFKDVAEKRIDDRKLERIAPKTGFIELDQAIKGFVPGRLMTVSGDTNIGKSALAANFAYNVAQQGKKALYFALEPDRVITEYIISAEYGKSFDDITDEDLRVDIPNIDIITSDQVGTVSDLDRIIGELPRYDLVIVDHLGYFTGSGDSTYREESKILKKLALIAQQKMSLVLVIAHLNKTFNVTEKNWIPRMNQISGSAAFKQDSDEVLLIGRKPEMTEYDTVKYSDFGVIVVGKTKSGGDGSVIAIRFHEGKALITGFADARRQAADETVSDIKNSLF